MIERVIEIPYRKGDGLYGHLFSMANTIQSEFPDRISDEQIIEIIDPAVDTFMDNVRRRGGGWEVMEDWINERWPVGYSGDLGSRSESLPLHIAYALTRFTADGDIAWHHGARIGLDSLLSRVFGQFENLVEPPEISIRIDDWGWKLGVDRWSEDLLLPTELFQIDPDSLKGWEIVIHGIAHDSIINRRFK